MLTATKDDPFVGMHYALSGYVKRGGIVPPPAAWVKPDGVVIPQSFTVIMQNRPNDCRFAIAQIVRLVREASKNPNTPLFRSEDHPSGPYVVWDLLDDQLTRGQRTGPGGVMSPPPPMWMAESEDGMLMKALAFYDHHP